MSVKLLPSIEYENWKLSPSPLALWKASTYTTARWPAATLKNHSISSRLTLPVLISLIASYRLSEVCMDASVPVCVPCERCSLNATTWIGLPVAKELYPSPSASLSQASPLPSPSRSAWLGLATNGQLSEASGRPSLSSSGSTQSARPSPSVSRNPSSVAPLQLSSRPLQISCVGPPGMHGWVWPPTQFATVRAQAPTPQVVLPRPSSIGPSQSSSTPLQTSVPGVPGVQVCGTPPEQLLTVRVHAPTPHVVVPNPSSTSPLQSSSRPLHCSVAPGWTAGL